MTFHLHHHHHHRSLPAGISFTEPTPPTSAEYSTAAMGTTDSTTSGSSLVTFTKTIILPILIALILYLILFYALLPAWRHQRNRYANYLPLNHLPESLQPSTLRQRLSSVFLRFFLPSAWSVNHTRGAHSSRNRRPSIPSTISEESDSLSDRFSDDHGEAMVGFDINSNTNAIQDQNRRRRDGMERQVARGILAAREMNATTLEPSPESRLSRELESGFRDDSDDDDEDEERGVTVGRRSLSVSRR